MKRGTSVAILLLTGCSFAAAGGIGTWRNFTSMKDVNGIARSGNMYWAASSGGLFGWQTGTTSYHQVTSAEGLLSIDLTCVAVDGSGNVWTGDSTQGFVQVYSPADGSLRIIRDFADNQTLTDKRINSLTIRGDTALICMNSGFSLFFVNRFEFGDTYLKFGSLPVSARFAAFDATIFGGKIWAAVSDRGSNNCIVSASLDNPNRLPPQAWTVQIVGSSAVVPRTLTVFHGQLYTGTSNGLYTYDGISWSPVPGLAGIAITATDATADLLFAVTAAGNVYALDPLGTLSTVGPALPSMPTSITISETGDAVIGVLNGGILVRATSWESHFPDGPNSNQFLSVAVDPDGVVWGASASSAGKGFYRYNGTNWKTFTNQNSPLPVNEVYRVSIGCDGSVWASTAGHGIVEVPRGTDAVDSAHAFGRNVGMVGIDTSFIVVSTVACDGAGNTWMCITKPDDNKVLAIRTSNGTWTRIPVRIGNTTLFNLMDGAVDRGLAVDAFNNLWAVDFYDDVNRGIFSLQNGGAVSAPSPVYLSTNNGLPSNRVTTIVVDQDGALWAGTDNGIGIVLDTQNPTADGAIAKYQPLLGNAINAIAVDALNQKWVATPQGIIVLSPDGTETVATYTTANTAGKLIDNDVKSIAIDGGSGTVYFGTLKGLASLTTASVAPKNSFSELVVYPNPFKIPSSTPLTIDSLVANTELKILAIDGHLVRDIATPNLTPGGRVGFWDGKDDQGHDVASGIYLVVAFSQDGSQVAVGKVAVLRK